MKFGLSALAAAVVGAAVAVAVIIPVTSAIEGDTRPDAEVDVSEEYIEYGDRSQNA